MKRFAEFFAGVGLVREGLNKDSWSCIWANDISQDKKETYVNNYGSDDFWLGDIWDVAKNSNIIPDNIFLYTASFPCTDLSVAGGRAGLAGSESGTLNAFMEILQNKEKAGDKPRVVLLENVQGFLTSHQGKDVANTVRYFSELGYYVDIIELDAVYFTPQSRPRVFLIAVEEALAHKAMILKDKNEPSDEWWRYFEHSPELRTQKIRSIILGNENLNWGLFDIAINSNVDCKLIDILETDIPDESTLWWNQERQAYLFSQMSENHKSTLAEMISASEYSYGTVYRRMRQGRSMAELRTDGVAGCLRTPRGGSSRQILIKAGKGDWQVRLLTPREYARLQGVRDSFILPQNDNKGYFAMGDAVCVPAIEFISKNILNPVYEASKLVKQIDAPIKNNLHKSVA